MDLSLYDGVSHNVNRCMLLSSILTAVARRTPSPNVAACRNKDVGRVVVFDCMHCKIANNSDATVLSSSFAPTEQCTPTNASISTLKNI
jgi:hypothetical protein